MILEALKDTQDAIFPDSDACKVLKSLIEEQFEHFEVLYLSDVFYLSTGMFWGVRRAKVFIGQFLLCDSVCESPSKLVESFLERKLEA